MSTQPRGPLRRMAARSAFGDIIARYVERADGCVGGVVVDHEGEAVDAAGHLDPFELQILGAQLCVVFGGLPSGAFELIVGADAGSFLVRGLADGYLLVTRFEGDGAFAASKRLVRWCEAELSREAGLRLRGHDRVWWPVEVEGAASGGARPERVRVGALWHGVVVLGVVRGGLDDGSVGFRCRVDVGLDVTLLRERDGAWWSDERIG